MLFNSLIFLFGFLPVTVLLFFVLGRFSVRAARLWLAAASLFFYAWWNPPYLILLAISIVFNYGAGYLLQFRERVTFALPSPRLILALGLVFNIGFLGYFKYSTFLAENLNTIAGTDFVLRHVALPLAISFFTFQKIAYLVDSYLGKVKETSFLNYVLFAAFFPQLIAGPIVHYSEIFPQFKKLETYRFQWANFTEGLSLFLLGLAKKVVLADEFARYSDVVFNNAQGGAVSLVPAWVGALSYTLQLYFDFSGYSDMAIGLARMFNIELPLNFWSPYKSASIMEFWRRWHMTLSRFLRDYVYIPLGGNRHGEPRRYINLIVTMLVGGFWHGAGWTYVLWGGLHGTALAGNHLWARLVPDGRKPLVYRMAAHLLTLMVVVCGWVIFRSPSLAVAGQMFGGMLNQHGAYLPDQVLALFPVLRHAFDGIGQVPYLGDSTVMGAFELLVMLLMGYGTVFLAPNLYQMSRRQRLVVVAISFAFAFQKIVFAGAMSPFLYFQF